MSGQNNHARAKAANPSNPMMVTAGTAPSQSAIRPRWAKPKGPRPIQTESTPIRRLRTSGEASNSIMVDCMVAKQPAPMPVATKIMPDSNGQGDSANRIKPAPAAAAP